MKTFRLLLLLIMAVTAQARVDEFENLKASVQSRSSAIQELKDHTMVRETERGQLEWISDQISPENRKLVDAENADRLRLFQIIARRTNSSTEEVAQKFAQEAMINTGRSQVYINPDTGLPLKVLTRPHVNIFSDSDEHAQKVRENTPAFTAYFVYQPLSKGWYRVGSDNRGKVIGWMRAEDVIEWKHDLVVQFTHPQGRLPVLMFGEKAPLSELVATPKKDRQPAVFKLYRTIEGKNLPQNFPVLAMEPKRALPNPSGRNPDQFYLLPIISFDQTDMDGREGRLLELATAARERGQISIISSQRPPDPQVSDRVKVDLVFVMDLTRSMGPFADRTLEMITECTQRFRSDPKALEAIRFGFWGYRDFPELCHGIEFNTRNYTPELQELSDFANTLHAVQETKVDSIDYEEDVLAGVADAIQKTNWRQDAIRIIILVGDAPGRGPRESDPYCTVTPRPIGTKSGMNAESIRRLANAREVYITALYLKTPKWKKYAPIGERQFRILSRNPNVQPGHENFRFVDAQDTAVYRAAAKGLTDGVIECIRAAQSHHTQLSKPDGQDGGGDVNDLKGAEQTGVELANKMFQGALVEWLARRDPAQVPRDVTVWAADKDLADPAIQTLDVQIFLTKNQLDSLDLAVDQYLRAGRLGRMTGQDFFGALQAVVATVTRAPDQVRNAETLAKAGVVPKFLKGLPYHSALMEMTDETWSSMSPDAQDQFLTGIESKLRFYKEIHDNSEKWQPLNPGDESDDWVANVPLEELP